MLTAPPRDAEVSLSKPLPTIPSSDADETVLSWTVHLLRGQAHRLPRIGLGLASVLFVGLLVFHNPLLALLPALALLGSLSEFLFPIHYRLTRRGAQARQGPATWQIDWRDVRHAYLAPDGIKLSPLPRPQPHLEPLRGVFLRFGDDGEAVLAVVRRLREEARPDG